MRPLVSFCVPVRFLAALALLSATGGCAAGLSGGAPLMAPPRAARDVPERFEVADPALRSAPRDTAAGLACLSPMLDPRDGTRLRMVRAAGGIGDYEVPDGRYGVGPGDVLRLECNTGRVIGITRRQRQNP